MKQIHIFQNCGTLLSSILTLDQKLKGKKEKENWTAEMTATKFIPES